MSHAWDVLGGMPVGRWGSCHTVILSLTPVKGKKRGLAKNHL